MQVWPGKASFLALDITRPGIEIWWCLECSEHGSLIWHKERKRFIWEDELAEEEFEKESSKISQNNTKSEADNKINVSKISQIDKEIKFNAIFKIYKNKLNELFWDAAIKTGYQKYEIILMLKEADSLAKNDQFIGVSSWDDKLITMAQHAKLSLVLKYPNEQSKRENLSKIWDSQIQKMNYERSKFYVQIKPLF